METCDFCEEFNTRICTFLSPPRNRFLFESDDFLIFPPLGSFVEGYLLVCPRIHVPSCASLDRQLLGDLQKLITRTKQIVKRIYHSPIVFEHGLASCERKAGGCIDHAHLHFIPLTVDLNKILFDKFAPEVLNDWSELADWQGRPYLLTENIEGPILISEVPDNLPSQFLRRQITTTLKIQKHWDWGGYLGLDEINNTLIGLANSFQELQAVTD